MPDKNSNKPEETIESLVKRIQEIARISDNSEEKKHIAVLRDVFNHAKKGDGKEFSWEILLSTALKKLSDVVVNSSDTSNSDDVGILGERLDEFDHIKAKINELAAQKGIGSQLESPNAQLRDPTATFKQSNQPNSDINKSDSGNTNIHV